MCGRPNISIIPRLEAARDRNDLDDYAAFMYV